MIIFVLFPVIFIVIRNFCWKETVCMYICGGLAPAISQIALQPLPHSALLPSRSEIQGKGENSWMNSTCEAKAAHEGKAEQGIPLGKQVSPQEAGPQQTQHWLGNTDVMSPTVPVPSVSPPRHLPTRILLIWKARGEWETEKTSAMRKHLSPVAEALRIVLSGLFSAQIRKAAFCGLLWRKWTPSQPEAAQWEMEMKMELGFFIPQAARSSHILADLH